MSMGLASVLLLVRVSQWMTVKGRRGRIRREGER
jgi:hypothetical protein